MKKLLSVGSATIVWALSSVVTCCLFLLYGPLREHYGLWTVSLFALLLAELFGYIYVLWLVRNSRRAVTTVPVYLTFGTLIVFYGGAVLFHMIVFWWLVPLSLRTYMMIHLITLALLGIGIAVSRSAMGYVERQEGHEQTQVQMMRQMQAIMHTVRQQVEADETADTALKSSLTRLADDVQFSDPISHPSMVSMEENLLWQIEQLEKSVRQRLNGGDAAGQAELSSQLIRDISTDLTKRNRQLLLLK